MGYPKADVEYTFDSLSEYIEYTKGNAPSWNKFRSSVNGDDDFCGGLSQKEAYQHVQTGWAEGTAKIAEASAMLDIGNSMTVKTKQLRQSFVGRKLNKSAWRAGKEKAFYKKKRRPAQKPIVKIGFPLGGLADMTHQEFINKGTAVLALVEAIQLSGTAVELWGTAGVSIYSNKYLAHHVLLKAGDEPLDLDKLAFVSAHSAFHRRINFSSRENLTAEEYKTLKGRDYGATKTVHNPNVDFMAEYDQNAFRTKETALEWIVEQAKKAGIELELV